MPGSTLMCWHCALDRLVFVWAVLCCAVLCCAVLCCAALNLACVVPACAGLHRLASESTMVSS
jgi:hypothetical protein